MFKPRVFGIWFAICCAAASCCAAQSDEPLVPVSPLEEQGRRAVSISFGHSQDAQSQDEELPAPPPATESQSRPTDRSANERSHASASEPVRQRYPDGKVHILRYVRQDEFGNYFNDGPWKLFNRSGQVMAEGQFVDGSMNGTWSRWHPADADGIFRTPPFANQQGPFLSIASFNFGKLDGVWTIYDRSRRKIFEMQYVAGKRHGTASWWSPTGFLVREMKFSQGAIDGIATEYDNSQRPVSQANFAQGRRETSRVTWYAQNKKKSEDFYLDAQLELQAEDNWWDAKPADYTRVGDPVRHGPTRLWYESGQLRMEGGFREGKRNGSFSWWYANGQEQLSGEFADDQKSGSWTWWHENGMKAVQGIFLADRPVGVWSWWDDEGKIVRAGEMGPSDLKMETPSADDPAALAPPSSENLEDISPDAAEASDSGRL
jgi:antitoxin component YwqK of YwqJK toxin-antitoxin module